jgi:hypothetical protein
MLICCERKILFVRWKVLWSSAEEQYSDWVVTRELSVAQLIGSLRWNLLFRFSSWLIWRGYLYIYEFIFKV